MTTTVFLVTGLTSHEQSSPMRVCETRPDAEKFVAAMVAYDKTRAPVPPNEYDATGEEVFKAFGKWNKADGLWQAAHPGGQDACYCDDYAIVELPYYAKGQV